MKLIDKILERFGYIQKNNKTDLDEDDLVYLLASKLNIDLEDEIDDEYEKKIFSDLKNVDGFIKYLREAAARDKNRYFAAGTTQEQLIIRGSFARTMYLKSKLSKAHEV